MLLVFCWSRCNSRCAPRQWHVQGRICILRCVPFGCRQAQDARHLGRCGPEGQLRDRRRYSSGVCLAGVAGVCTSFVDSPGKLCIMVGFGAEEQ